MGMIGVLTGLVACLIDVCVIQTTDLKFQYIKECILNLFNYHHFFASSRHIYLEFIGPNPILEFIFIYIVVLNKN